MNKTYFVGLIRLHGLITSLDITKLFSVRNVYQFHHNQVGSINFHKIVSALYAPDHYHNTYMTENTSHVGSS